MNNLKFPFHLKWGVALILVEGYLQGLNLWKILALHHAFI